MRSLRARLFAYLAAFALITTAAVGAATYAGVLRETDRLLDYQLQQMALSLRDQGTIAEDQRVALDEERLDVAIQIWRQDGALIYTLPAANPLPRRTALGYHEIDLPGGAWRAFGTTAGERVIQVAQPHEARRRLAAAAAWRSVAPLLLAMPLIAAGLWWLLGASLSPLRRVTAALAERNAGSLQALPTAGLPSEAAPVVVGFNELLARLDAAFGSQRRFVADAAHELRTPLTALKLQLDLLRTAPDRASRVEAEAGMAAAIERSRRLVEQLLALARCEPQQVAPTRAPVDLAELLRVVARDSSPLAAQRGVVATVDAPAPVHVAGDADALRALLSNLVDNALTHAGATRLSLRARPAGDDDANGSDGPRLSVEDDGVGIPPEDRERVFDRFHRLHPGDGKGSGLGLAIVRAVAEQHGATVLLGVAALGGLRVEMRFPRAD